MCQNGIILAVKLDAFKMFVLLLFPYLCCGFVSFKSTKGLKVEKANLKSNLSRNIPNNLPKIDFLRVHDVITSA